MPLGRKTKCTPELTTKFAALVKAGAYISTACHALGVDEFTVQEWIRRGENRHSARGPAASYTQFAQAIEKARADDELECNDLIRKASRGGAVLYRRTRTDRQGNVYNEERYSEPQWAAAMTLLERRYPDRYARRTPEGGDRELIEIVLKIQDAHPLVDQRVLDVPSTTNGHEPPALGA